MASKSRNDVWQATGKHINHFELLHTQLFAAFQGDPLLFGLLQRVIPHSGAEADDHVHSERQTGDHLQSDKTAPSFSDPQRGISRISNQLKSDNISPENFETRDRERK